jgi:alpha-L-arabinofuranosidase
MKRLAGSAALGALMLWSSTLALRGRAAEGKVTKAGVRITREPLCGGTISPFQYGQFVEYLCDLVPAMWAEKLCDGSFEGLSPYKFVFLKETDFKERPWYPSGEVNRTEIVPDTATKVSGAASKRITIEPGAPATAGISQNGIFLERGQACHLAIWLRARGVTGPVRVRLHHEAKVYATCEFQPGEEWQKFSARLVPSGRDVNATLSIEFRGPGTLWLDNASLMPEDTVGGWRPDVVAAVRALKPGIIRFGGSAIDAPGYGEFEWKHTIGDPDHREPFRAWGGLQPTGPGLEEIVQFCRAVGAEPLICVRFNGRTPRDAAEEVEYFNGATNTPMGAWRARNGHPAPYRVKYWQVGNEIQGADYDARLAGFCQAMKEADPAIKLLSSYPSPARLKSAGQWLDYTCPHHYGCSDLAAMRNDFAHLREMLRENAPGRDIKIAVTEWNTTAGDAGPRRAMLWTLANALACSRYHNLLHRQCDLVEIANRSNLINSFCSGILQTDNHRLYKTPTYYAQQLYATLAGNRPLRCDSALPSNAGLDLSATLSAKDDEVVLFVVNDTLTAITCPLDFSAFGSRGVSMAVWTLTDRQHAGEPDVANSFAEPERVAPVQATFRAQSARFDYSFPPLSLTVLRWKVK